MKENYTSNGYCLIQQFLSAQELKMLRLITQAFHQNWKLDNQDFYSKRAINSAYLTGQKYLKKEQREGLFVFLASHHFMDVVEVFFGKQVAFMNTQLFFNPVNAKQKNYWHRDAQYHLSLDEQKKALHQSQIIHFRVALENEPGIEVVPGTHSRWDTKEELDVRLEHNGRSNFEELPDTAIVELKAGDLLVFSGHIIHRGLYGGKRMALDILMCDPKPELLSFVDDDCLPDAEIISRLQNPVAFEHTISSRE